MSPTLLKTLLGSALFCALVPAQASSLPVAAPVQSSFAAPADQVIAAAVDTFYLPRPDMLIWLKAGPASPGPAALIRALRRAPLDGLSSGPQLAEDIQHALAAATDRPSMLRADRLMSAAWLRYVAALHAPAPGMVYNDPRLTPRTPAAGYILEQAARAPSLPDHIDEIGRASCRERVCVPV